MNVGKNTTLGNGDVTEKLVQLFVIADGKLKMTWDNARLLVVASGVTSKFQDFCGKIFQDGGQVDGSTFDSVLVQTAPTCHIGIKFTGTDTLGVVSFPQKTMDTTNGKCETCFRRSTGEKC